MKAGAGSGERLLGRDFSLVCISNFLAFFSIYLIVPVLPVFLEEKGYDNFVIGALMSMMVVAALLRPFFGHLSVYSTQFPWTRNKVTLMSKEVRKCQMQETRKR